MQQHTRTISQAYPVNTNRTHSDYICVFAQAPHLRLQMKIINCFRLIFITLTNDFAAVIY